MFSTRHSYMQFCFDPDASTQKYEYLSNESNSRLLRFLSLWCARLPSPNILSQINKFIDERILKLLERPYSTLRAITDHAKTVQTTEQANIHTPLLLLVIRKLLLVTLLHLFNLKHIVQFNMKSLKQ